MAFVRLRITPIFRKENCRKPCRILGDIRMETTQFRLTSMIHGIILLLVAKNEWWWNARDFPTTSHLQLGKMTLVLALTDIRTVIPRDDLSIAAKEEITLLLWIILLQLWPFKLEKISTWNSKLSIVYLERNTCWSADTMLFIIERSELNDTFTWLSKSIRLIRPHSQIGWYVNFHVNKGTATSSFESNL